MRRLRSWQLFLLAPFLAWPAGAQEFPGIARGFEPEKAYQIGEIEHVSLFNGGLTLTLPLGGSVPVGPSFGLGFSLVYNSHLWRYEEVPNVGTLIFPSEQFNAGLGWSLSVAKLYHPDDPFNDSDSWILLDQSGARHDFYQTLHSGDTDEGNTVLYSRDGSYLRMVLGAAPPTIPASVAVHLPDGSEQVFEKTPNTTRSFRLKTLRDAFSNTVDVTYFASTEPPPSSLPLFTWRFSSPATFGNIDVVFDTSPAAGYYATKGGVLKYLRLKATGNRTATYTFSYLDPVPELTPGCASQMSGPVKIPFLTSVLLPEGTSWQMPSYDLVGGGSCNNLLGLIRSLRLPTQGQMEWSWRQYAFPNALAGQCREALYNQVGLAERRHLDRDGNTPAASNKPMVWTYTQAFNRPPTCPNAIPPPENRPEFSTVTVVSPLGDATQHFFGVNIAGPPELYGYPGNTTIPPTSSTIYEGSVASGILRRTTQVRYEWDSGGSGPDTGTRANQRLAFTKTIYNDDNGKFASATYSDFDGFGHYRQSTFGGTFGAGDVRDSLVDYNPSRPAYPHNTNGGFDWTWPATDKWLLNTYGETKVCEGALFNGTQSGCNSGGQFAREQLCFDPGNGFLKRHRALAGASPAANDLLAVYTPTTPTPGFVATEAFYGGDGGGLGVGDVCTASLGPEDYRIRHTYQNRVRALSEYMASASTPMPFKSLDLTIDQWTGLPTVDRDTAGLATGLEYDLLGRLIWAKPPLGHGAWTQILYNNAQGTSKASVGIKRRDNGVTSGPALADSSIVFDDLGRVYREFVVLANGTSGRRQTIYNAIGWKDRVSEQATPNEGNINTLYFNYDPFGRPRGITPPDGAAHGIQLSYAGDRIVTRTVPIGTSRNASTGAVIEEPVATTEIYDRQGRLSQVQELSGTGATASTTLYKYDEGGRLRETGTNGQARTFNYDGRGFLNSETHPEKGATGQGTVSYGGYDARGHATTKTDGPFSLTYAYDRAERLLSIRDANNSNRLLKEWQYDTGAWAGSFPLGKATQAIRHNWINLPWNGVATDVAITEQNTFSGRDGRLSARTTSSSLNAYAFGQSWVYNALGQVTSVGYPNCTHATCTGSAGAAPARTVGMTYTNGWLTGITGFGELTWHSNGLVHQVKHGVGPAFPQIDTQQKDPSFMRRPLSISPSTLPVTLGPYKYDGAGNITDVGNNRFLYDRVSRLKNFEFDSGQKQAYTYDVFGNLTGITTTRPPAAPVAQSFTVLGLTNRLSSVPYDAAGNQTSWGAFGYSYDAFGMMTRMTGSGNDNTHIYTADDERLWTMDFTAGLGEAGTVHTFRLRDADGKALRELRLTGLNLTGNWSFRKDYIHRDAGRLLASVASGNVVNHFTLDHLGTPRLVTNNTGGYVSDHHYFAYGEELTPQTSDALKFTGHERDFNEGGGIGISDDLDYMHARFHSPVTGRFLSVDPVIQMGRSKRAPQLWNRYTYAAGNPLKYVDPTGRVGVLTGSAEEQKKTLSSLRNGVPTHLRMFVRTTEKDGKTILDARYLNMMKGSTSGNFQTLRTISNSPGIVTMTTSASSFTARTSQGTSTEPLSSDSTLGVTLTAGRTSTKPGETQVLVAGDLGARDSAETLAHELRHASRFLQGKQYQHEMTGEWLSPEHFIFRFDPKGPVNMSTAAAEAEARDNYDPFVPPQ